MDIGKPTEGVMLYTPPPNPWARISEIAARVGVAPDSGDASIYATGADGKAYDIMAVVIAVLDHIENKSKR